MPRIDPLQLLTCLKPLLSPNGGIQSSSAVKRLSGLMAKYSKKLVSKCIYIHILKCTETELLGQFMGLGGWNLTHTWLNDGIRGENWPLVQDILELLLLCPVDVDRLKSNTSPKLVKGLCKDGGNEGVRILALKLVEQWLKVVKEETQTQNSITSTTTTGATTNENQLNSNETNKNLTEPNKNFKNNSDVIVTMSSEGDCSIELNDPLEISKEKKDLNQVLDERINGETTVVYKLIIKDGKQMLTKVENSSFIKDDTDFGKKSGSNINKTEEERGNEKENDNCKGLKEKDKIREEKAKDKSKEHKSSNSNHYKSSSKSSSSSSKSKSGSSSSSKSKSSHKSSSDGKSRDRDSDKEKHRSSSSSSGKDKHRDRDRDKDRSSKDKEKERKDKSKDKEKDKMRDKEKSKHSSKDKEEDKEKEKAKQVEKDKETLSKITPTTLEKLGRIPKKSKDENSDAPTSITIPSKKASMSIEIRKDTERPKTVKTYNSQFRSHGLTDEAPPPPSRKGLKKPSIPSVPGTAIPSNMSLKRLSPTPSSSNKDSPVEKKAKIELNLTSTGSNEKANAIKLIPPKPKPSTLVESDMFMDALSASALIKKDNKKRKRRPSTTKETLKDGTPPPDSSSASSNDKVAPLKFYQDTLEDKEDNTEEKDSSKQEKDKNDEEDDDIPLKHVKEAIDKKVEEDKNSENSKDNENDESYEPPAKKPPGPGCGPEGPPGVLMIHRRRGPKKKVTWKPQEDLEDIRFFELDETERVNVTKTFVDMKQIDRLNEHEAFLLARKLNCEDVMTEQTQWMPLILVDGVPPQPEGNQSREKRIQAEREQTTLKALYFNRHMIPDSPAEPDMEHYQITEPAVIPLDDITGNTDAINDFTNIPWPESKGSPLPPETNENDFVQRNEAGFHGNQFNPFTQFGQSQWSLQGNSAITPPSINNNTQISNGVLPGAIIGQPPLNGFNNVNVNLTRPANDLAPLNMNMNLLSTFTAAGQNSNFGNAGNPPPFNSLVPPPNIGINANNFNQQRLDINRGQRNSIGINNRGNWRPGASVLNNQSGGNWRTPGPTIIGGFSSNWVQGNRGRVCKLFQRGSCRNGSKCNYLHAGNSHRI